MARSTNFKFKLSLAALICVAATAASAKLPAPSDEAKLKAAAAAAKTAWSDKLAAYQLCQVMNRVADGYRKSAKAAGREVQPAVETPACADPGPFVAPEALAAAAAPVPAPVPAATPAQPKK
ncbi:hypothetical protein LNV08_02095 [Paucibacter sp. TC2R-5]|uniref:hypothetical protein n=1 Tax=Paucibacter sp. TC2R-5 TaxID=2893555 RepID=UPI0021E425AA|nr:hypothetical protein [Paucibacter sp. TC2R-5]MCV2357758.1 hypothetical protein [Paucibacter sp. TC2R-5]